jgi:hypothetical protein
VPIIKEEQEQKWYQTKHRQQKQRK